MQNAKTLLYDRYSVLHIESTNRFNKVLFVLDTYQNPPRNCVIKIFQPIAEKFEILQWIDREFSLEANRLKQASLRNSHLPQIYTYSNDSRSYYLVRELVEGRTLQEKVQATGKFSVQEVRAILIELLSVLDYIHDQGIIHQNIKPKNIILRNGDSFPMLINFGSINQIVSTYGFYGDQQIFSSNNIYGYAPSELALGKSVPTSDLYSLGLTAIYLLTAKNPVDFPANSDLSNFKIPSVIASLDWDLARIISRAIKPSVSDRYNSAQEMLDDLLHNNSSSIYQQIVEKIDKPLLFKTEYIPQINTPIDRDKESNYWKKIVYLLGGLYILSNAIIALYDWNLNQNIIAPGLPKLLTSLSSPAPNPLTSKAVTKPSILNRESKDLIEIPILATGTSKQELRSILGEPNIIQKGYLSNSIAWIYKNRANGSVDMGYLFDLDTDKLRQTEIAIASSVGLGTIQDILGSLLEGDVNPSTEKALKEIYQRQANKYSFQLENLEGSIEREADDHIYLGVWEADFH